MDTDYQGLDVIEKLPPDEKIAQILERLSEVKPLLSLEKIVAGSMLFVVLSVCGWVSLSIQTLTTQVIELKINTEHTSVALLELKTEVKANRAASGSIELILERMKSDDERETRDTKSIDDLEKRILVLEVNARRVTAEGVVNGQLSKLTERILKEQGHLANGM